MKKSLAILLSVVMLLTMVFTGSASATVPTGNEIADGEWFSSMQKNTPYTDTAGEGAFAIPTDVINNNHTAYTFIKGLKPNTNYTLTFDKVGTDLHQSVSGVVAGTSLTWAEPNYNYIERSVNPMLGTPTLNGSTYTIEFTTTDVTDYSLLFRVINGGTTTLSNFCLTEVAPPTPEEIAGNAIADGDWYSSMQKDTPYTDTAGEGAFAIPAAVINNNHTAYTFIKGLKPNTNYTLTFDKVGTDLHQSVSGVVAGTSLTWAEPNYNYIERSVNPMLGTPTLNGSTYTIEFTTTDVTDYSLLFRVINGGTTTLSNFCLTEVAPPTPEEIAGNAVVNGTWFDRGADHTVSSNAINVTSANYQWLYTTIAGLDAKTTYTLTMTHNAGENFYLLANTSAVVAGSAPTFDGDTLTSEKVASYDYTATHTDEIITIRFTTDAAGDYTVMLRQNNISTFTLSNFVLSKTAVYEFVGTSIRAASAETKQGLRFIEAIDKSMLTNGVNGKAVAEVGMVAAVAAKVDGELTLETDGAKNGVAYGDNGAVRKFFSEDSNYSTMSAALTGLQPSQYNVDMSVRSYVKLADGTVIYGTTNTYCIYDVMKGILSKGSEADQLIVNNILDANDGVIRAAYEAWLAE